MVSNKFKASIERFNEKIEKSNLSIEESDNINLKDNGLDIVSSLISERKTIRGGIWCNGELSHKTY